MPSYKLTTMDYLIDVIKGDKQLIPIKDIIPYKMFKYAEFKKDVVLEFCRTDPQLRKFVPDDWLDTKRASREYLWSEIATFGGDYVARISAHAIQMRQAEQLKAIDEANAPVSDEFETLLGKFLFVSNK